LSVGVIETKKEKKEYKKNIKKNIKKKKKKKKEEKKEKTWRQERLFWGIYSRQSQPRLQ